MTDPLSITFGVVGTTAVVLHSVKKLRSFIESIEGAPTAVTRISNDLKALTNVLETLETKAKDPNFGDVDSRASILKLINEPLNNCGGIIEVISQKLQPFVKPTKEASKTKWKSFLFAYREKDFKDLQSLLLSYKSSVEIALSAATLYVTSLIPHVS